MIIIREDKKKAAFRNLWEATDEGQRCRRFLSGPLMFVSDMPLWFRCCALWSPEREEMWPGGIIDLLRPGEAISRTSLLTRC